MTAQNGGCPISQWYVLKSSPEKGTRVPSPKATLWGCPPRFSDPAPLRWEERRACRCEKTVTPVFTTVCTPFSRLMSDIYYGGSRLCVRVVYGNPSRWSPALRSSPFHPSPTVRAAVTEPEPIRRPP